MANGSAALLILDPPFIRAPSGNADADPSALEKKIGAATAAAVGVLAMAICDVADRGATSACTRAWAGATLGHLAELQLDLLDDPLVDFDAIARREGMRAFRRHPSQVFLTRFGPGQVDVVISELIGHVITVSGKVATDELALRAN